MSDFSSADLVAWKLSPLRARRLVHDFCSSLSLKRAGTEKQIAPFRDVSDMFGDLSKFSSVSTRYIRSLGGETLLELPQTSALQHFMESGSWQAAEYGCAFF